MNLSVKPLLERNEKKNHQLLESSFDKAIMGLEQVHYSVVKLICENKINRDSWIGEGDHPLNRTNALLNDTIDLLIDLKGVIDKKEVKEKTNGHNSNTSRLERKKETSDSRACS